MTAGLILLTVFGLAMIAGPMALGAATLIQIVGFVLGLFALLLVAYAKIYQSYFVKVPNELALIRIGRSSKQEVFIGEGCFIFPGFHEASYISLETIRIPVEKEGDHSLICADNLRADVRVDFFLQVPGENEMVWKAAKTLGTIPYRGKLDRDEARMAMEAVVAKKMLQKLEAGIRSVGAQTDFMALHQHRDEFTKSVKENVGAALSENGLLLETPSLSSFDQTDKKFLASGTVFNAEALRAIEVRTQKALTDAAEARLNGELARKTKAVETTQRVLEQERVEAGARAEQARDVANMQAERSSEAAVFAAEQDEKQRLRETQRDQAVQAAEIERERTVETARRAQGAAVAVAEERADQEKETARVARETAIQVAERTRDISIANEEKKRAVAEGDRLLAEADRARAEQAVKLVEVEAAAEREKRASVIAAEADATKKKIDEYVKVDVAAYDVEKKASAERAAAENKAAARLTLADADQKSRERAAAGMRAEQMVPVEVDARRVEVDNARVDVLQRELEAKSKFSGAALQFELDKFRIQMGGEVAKAAAAALGTTMGKSTMQLFGTPELAGNMLEQLSRGMGLQQMVNGLLSPGPSANGNGHVSPAAALAGLSVAGLSAVLNRFGIELPDEALTQLLQSMQSKASVVDSSDNEAAAVSPAS